MTQQGAESVIPVAPLAIGDGGDLVMHIQSVRCRRSVPLAVKQNVSLAVDVGGRVENLVAEKRVPSNRFRGGFRASVLPAIRPGYVSPGDSALSASISARKRAFSSSSRSRCIDRVSRAVDCAASAPTGSGDRACGMVTEARPISRRTARRVRHKAGEFCRPQVCRSLRAPLESSGIVGPDNPSSLPGFGSICRAC